MMRRVNIYLATALLFCVVGFGVILLPTPSAQSAQTTQIESRAIWYLPSLQQYAIDVPVEHELKSQGNHNVGASIIGYPASEIQWRRVPGHLQQGSDRVYVWQLMMQALGVSDSGVKLRVIPQAPLQDVKLLVYAPADEQWQELLLANFDSENLVHSKAVDGSTIVLEIQSPDEEFDPGVAISEVAYINYFYNQVNSQSSQFHAETLSHDSDFKEVLISRTTEAGTNTYRQACSWGHIAFDDTDNTWDSRAFTEADAVVRYTYSVDTGNSGSSFSELQRFCSGTLLKDANNIDSKLFMTARHCYRPIVFEGTNYGESVETNNSLLVTIHFGDVADGEEGCGGNYSPAQGLVTANMSLLAQGTTEVVAQGTPEEFNSYKDWALFYLLTDDPENDAIGLDNLPRGEISNSTTIDGLTGTEIATGSSNGASSISDTWKNLADDADRVIIVGNPSSNVDKRAYTRAVSSAASQISFADDGAVQIAICSEFGSDCSAVIAYGYDGDSYLSGGASGGGVFMVDPEVASNSRYVGVFTHISEPEKLSVTDGLTTFEVDTFQGYGFSHIAEIRKDPRFNAAFFLGDMLGQCSSSNLESYITFFSILPAPAFCTAIGREGLNGALTLNYGQAFLDPAFVVADDKMILNVYFESKANFATVQITQDSNLVETTISVEYPNSDPLHEVSFLDFDANNPQNTSLVVGGRFAGKVPVTLTIKDKEDSAITVSVGGFLLPEGATDATDPGAIQAHTLEFYLNAHAFAKPSVQVGLGKMRLIVTLGTFPSYQLNIHDGEEISLITPRQADSLNPVVLTGPVTATISVDIANSQRFSLDNRSRDGVRHLNDNIYFIREFTTPLYPSVRLIDLKPRIVFGALEGGPDGTFPMSLSVDDGIESSFGSGAAFLRLSMSWVDSAGSPANIPAYDFSASKGITNLEPNVSLNDITVAFANALGFDDPIGAVTFTLANVKTPMADYTATGYTPSLSGAVTNTGPDTTELALAEHSFTATITINIPDSGVDNLLIYRKERDSTDPSFGIPIATIYRSTIQTSDEGTYAYIDANPPTGQYTYGVAVVFAAETSSIAAVEIDIIRPVVASGGGGGGGGGCSISILSLQSYHAEISWLLILAWLAFRKRKYCY